MEKIMFFYIASFVICSITIIFCGTKLSKYGDIIAEKSSLGRSWIGVVLMASVTSLPKLITGISSVTYANTPNIATGDVLGSCMFNILIIAFLDVIDSKTPLLSKISQGNVISAAFSIFLIIIVVVGFSFPEIPTIGWLGFYSIIIFYLIIMKIIFQYEKRQLSHFISKVALQYENISTSKAVKQ
jgi:cation:H+ antiporter